MDIHTHAEEPCGNHADDGYDDLQTTMAKYIGAARHHPPTIPETAAHYRAQNIAAVIFAAVTFPVDAERKMGYRRHTKNEVLAERRWVDAVGMRSGNGRRAGRKQMSPIPG